MKKLINFVVASLSGILAVLFVAEVKYAKELERSNEVRKETIESYDELCTEYSKLARELLDENAALKRLAKGDIKEKLDELHKKTMES